MVECNKCLPYLSFKANYKPVEFIVGKKNSLVLIVGLNPKKLKDEKQHQYDLERTPTQLTNYFSEPGVHPYFKDFEKVSTSLGAMLGKDNGAASTDIIKCYSEGFPPPNCKGQQMAKIIKNCQPYLEQQLTKMKPRLVICNGADVCKAIRRIIIPIEDRGTSYLGTFGDTKIMVILSGFIGRIDNYAKRRLGVEFEKYMKELGIAR